MLRLLNQIVRKENAPFYIIRLGSRHFGKYIAQAHIASKSMFAELLVCGKEYIVYDILYLYSHQCDARLAISKTL